ncbi:MAG: SRPBCC family protein [Candidatus Nanopelagicales bacterium]
MPDTSVKSWTIETEVSPEVAFEYLSDVGRHAEWSPKPYRVDPVPELPLQQGVAYQSYGAVPGDKDHANQVEVTLVDAPHRLVLTCSDKGEQYVHQFDIASFGGGSRITRTVEAPRPTGFVRLIFPLIFAMFINPEVSKGMKMLKANLTSLRDSAEQN